MGNIKHSRNPIVIKEMIGKRHNRQFICETIIYITGYKIYIWSYFDIDTRYVYGLHITIFIFNSGNGLKKDSFQKHRHTHIHSHTYSYI